MYSSQYMQNKINYNRIMRGGSGDLDKNFGDDFFLDKNIRDARERQRQAAEVLQRQAAEVLQRQEADLLRHENANARNRIAIEQRAREQRERATPAQREALQQSQYSLANIDSDSEEVPRPIPLIRSG